MARTPADRSASSLRDQLAEVSAFVSEAGRADLTSAVDQALAPGGWEKLRATDPSRVEGSHNLAINIPISVRDQIREAAKKDPGTTTLTAKVNQGLGEYLAGRFQVPKRVNTRAMQAEKRVNLNVTASRALTGPATEKIRREAGERWASAARVAAEYLMFSYQLGPYAPGFRQEILPRGAERRLMVPREVRDGISDGARGSGDRITDVVNEGFQKFLDGSFDPEPPVWPGLDAAEFVPLKTNPDDALFERVKATVKERPGGLVRPSQVAIAYLLEEYGLAAGH